MALGLAAAAALPAQVAPPTDEEIKEFRSALEEHLSGNLPARVEHLRKIEPGAMDNPEAPGAPSWSAEPVHGTRIVTESVPDPNGGPPVLVTRTETFVEKTAAEVTSIWRRQAEQELRRIAQEAPCCIPHSSAWGFSDYSCRGGRRFSSRFATARRELGGCGNLECR